MPPERCGGAALCGTLVSSGAAVFWADLPSRAEMGVLLVASREAGAGAGADATESPLMVGVAPRRWVTLDVSTSIAVLPKFPLPLQGENQSLV